MLNLRPPRHTPTLRIPADRSRREADSVRSRGGHRTGMPHDDVLQRRPLREGVGHSVHEMGIVGTVYNLATLTFAIRQTAQGP